MGGDNQVVLRDLHYFYYRVLQLNYVGLAAAGCQPPGVSSLSAMAHLAQKASFAAAIALFLAASLTAAETTNAPPVGDGWYRGCAFYKAVPCQLH